MKTDHSRVTLFGTLDPGDVFLLFRDEILLCMKTLNGDAVVLTDGEILALSLGTTVAPQPDAKVTL